MKSVLRSLQNDPCRTHEISESEKTAFSNYIHLQRYHPAIDLFKIPESVFTQKNLELPSKYTIDTWESQDPEISKIWNTTRVSTDNTTPESCRTFIKVVHLLNPIDMIKEKYVCPEHPLIPQSENTWKKTLQKIHSHNNQAYVDTVANFVLSRFRELNLTPHCVLYYGSLTGISKSYQYNISQEYDTYRQCRWFWKGMKSHAARLTVIKGDADIEDIPNFEDIYKEITTCPFDENEPDTTDVELEPITTNEIEVSDIESVKSYTFDNIEENADNVRDIFEINKQIVGARVSLKNDHSETETESESESESDNED